jgi:hypothetical protein
MSERHTAIVLIDFKAMRGIDPSEQADEIVRDIISKVGVDAVLEDVLEPRIKSAGRNQQ